MGKKKLSPCEEIVLAEKRQKLKQADLRLKRQSAKFSSALKSGGGIGNVINIPGSQVMGASGMPYYDFRPVDYTQSIINSQAAANSMSETFIRNAAVGTSQTLFDWSRMQFGEFHRPVESKVEFGVSKYVDEEARRENERLKKELEETSGLLEQSNDALTRANNMHQDLRDIIRQKNLEHQQQIDSLGAGNEEQKRQLRAQHATEMEQYRQRLNNAQRDLAIAKDNYSNIYDRNQYLESELPRVQQQRTTFESKLKESEELRKQILASNQGLENNLYNATTLNKMHEKHVEELKGQLELNAQQASSTLKKALESQAAVAQLKQMELEKQLTTERTNAGAAQSESVMLKKMMNDVNKQYKDSQENAQRLQQNLGTKEQENLMLKQTNAQALIDIRQAKLKAIIDKKISREEGNQRVLNEKARSVLRTMGTEALKTRFDQNYAQSEERAQMASQEALTREGQANKYKERSQQLLQTSEKTAQELSDLTEAAYDYKRRMKAQLQQQAQQLGLNQQEINGLKSQVSSFEQQARDNYNRINNMKPVGTQYEPPEEEKQIPIPKKKTSGVSNQDKLIAAQPKIPTDRFGKTGAGTRGSLTNIPSQTVVEAQNRARANSPVNLYNPLTKKVEPVIKSPGGNLYTPQDYFNRMETGTRMGEFNEGQLLNAGRLASQLINQQNQTTQAMHASLQNGQASHPEFYNPKPVEVNLGMNQGSSNVSVNEGKQLFSPPRYNVFSEEPQINARPKGFYP